MFKMDAKQQPITHDEKSTRQFDEKADLEHVKQGGVLENADYTGAEAKTDPAEIALVRKIDWRLMVRLNSLKDNLALKSDAK